MTNQAIFDQVATHAMTQNESSINREGSCLYRGPEGLKCFIGALIPDAMYDEGMEGVGVEDLLYHYPEVQAFTGLDQVFLEDLQEVHDRLAPGQWREALIKVAQDHKLSAHATPKKNR